MWTWSRGLQQPLKDRDIAPWQPLARSLEGPGCGGEGGPWPERGQKEGSSATHSPKGTESPMPCRLDPHWTPILPFPAELPPAPLFTQPWSQPHCVTMGKSPALSEPPGKGRTPGSVSPRTPDLGPATPKSTLLAEPSDTEPGPACSPRGSHVCDGGAAELPIPASLNKASRWTSVAREGWTACCANPAGCHAGTQGLSANWLPGEERPPSPANPSILPSIHSLIHSSRTCSVDEGTELGSGDAVVSEIKHCTDGAHTPLGEGRDGAQEELQHNTWQEES